MDDLEQQVFERPTGTETEETVSPEAESQGKKEFGTRSVSPEQIQSLQAMVENLAKTMEFRFRVADRHATELGDIRKMIMNIPKQAPVQVAPPDPEADIQRLQQNPRGFIADVASEIAEKIKADIPKPQEDTAKRLRDEQRAFGMDHPDYKQYAKRMGELLELDDYRSYDQSGQPDAYKSYRNAYLAAKAEATESKGREAQNVRNNTRSEQEAAKAGAAISGGGSSGTERELPEGITPEKLRRMPLKDLIALGKKIGAVSETDLPKIR